MSKGNLWWANFLTKRIDKYENYAKKTNEWIKRDKADLKEHMKELTDEEHLEYRYQVGDIEQADYQVIKQQMEGKRCVKKR